MPLELGRSFVRAEYQRDPAALLLLWKGIGAYVARHPQLRRLFGPGQRQRRLHHRHPLARSRRGCPAMRAPSGQVEGRHAVAAGTEIDALLDAGAAPSLAALEQLVREIEDGRGLPVLLRQYLRLNGRVMAVSRDPAFGDAMDALLVVDLLEMPASHLERYCGRVGAERIRRYWGADAVVPRRVLSPAS